MFSRGTAEGVSFRAAEITSCYFLCPHWVAPDHVEFLRFIKHCSINQEIKEEQGGGRTRLSMMGVKETKNCL